MVINGRPAMRLSAVKLVAGEFVEKRKGEYEAVQLENLAPSMDARIDPDKLVWFISGDLAKIEADVAALGLGEIEVWDADGNRIR